MSVPDSSRAGRAPLSALRIASLIAPPLLVMVAIFTLSDQSSLAPSHGLFDLISRKAAHVTEYFVLTLCWIRAVHGFAPAWSARATLLCAVGVSLFYSVSDEFHQTFVTGRHGTPRDVLIDGIGMGLACLVAYAVYARRRRVGPSRPNAA